MSDCNLCIFSYDGDEADFYHSETRKARRQHTCCECGEQIQRGDTYEHVALKYDGAMSRHKTCAICVEIRTKFSCNGTWVFTTVWETMREEGFPVFTTGCLQGLSVKAKQKLVDEWNKWKFGKVA